MEQGLTETSIFNPGTSAFFSACMKFCVQLLMSLIFIVIKQLVLAEVCVLVCDVFSGYFKETEMTKRWVFFVSVWLC